MQPAKKIKDIKIPVRYELVDITKKGVIRKGKQTYLYRFYVRVNDRIIFPTRKEVYADNIRELKMHIIRFYF